MLLWDIPNKETTLESFGEFLLSRGNFKEVKRAVVGEKLVVFGTSEYGGYTHQILCGFELRGNRGLHTVCDSTDTVFDQVSSDFTEWTLGCSLIDTSIQPPQKPKTFLAPETGQTLFLHSHGGTQGAFVLGQTSYQSMFVGPEFKKATPEDGVEAQNPTFTDDARSDERSALESHFWWESTYIENMLKEVGKPKPEFTRFPVQVELCADGKPRMFSLWKARIGAPGDAADQYLLTTALPKGLAILTVIVTKPEHMPIAQRLMDSYRFGFSTMDATLWDYIIKQGLDKPPSGKK